MANKKKIIFVAGGIAAVVLSALAGYEMGLNNGRLYVVHEIGKILPNIVNKSVRIGYECTIDTIDDIDCEYLTYMFDHMTRKEFENNELYPHVVNNLDYKKFMTIAKNMVAVKKW